MKLLADENLHPLVVARLREAGHDVEYVRETAPGAKDAEILARPDIGTCLLLTYDRDFGDLIFSRGLPAPGAILYIRLNRTQPEAIASRLLDILRSGAMTGGITTVTQHGERIKSFPLGAEND